MAADGATIRPGMNVYDADERYVGVVARVYPVPDRFARGDASFGCFKVQRSPLPLVGPRPLLVPFDAVRALDGDRVILAATRAEAARWAQGLTNDG